MCQVTITVASPYYLVQILLGGVPSGVTPYSVIDGSVAPSLYYLQPLDSSFSGKLSGTILGNDFISINGLSGTYYTVSVIDTPSGQTIYQADYDITGSTYNLDTETPITPPVIPTSFIGPTGPTGYTGSGGGTPGLPTGSVQGNDAGVLGGVPGTVLDFVNGLIAIAPTGSGVALTVTGAPSSSDIQDWCVNDSTVPVVLIDTNGKLWAKAGIDIDEGAALSWRATSTPSISFIDGQTLGIGLNGAIGSYNGGLKLTTLTFADDTSFTTATFPTSWSGISITEATGIDIASGYNLTWGAPAKIAISEIDNNTLAIGAGGGSYTKGLKLTTLTFADGSSMTTASGFNGTYSGSTGISLTDNSSSGTSITENSTTGGITLSTSAQGINGIALRANSGTLYLDANIIDIGTKNSGEGINVGSGGVGTIQVTGALGITISDNSSNGIWLSELSSGINASGVYITTSTGEIVIEGDNVTDPQMFLQSENTGLSIDHLGNLRLYSTGNLSISSSGSFSVTPNGSSNIQDWYVNGGTSPVVNIDNVGNLHITKSLYDSTSSAGTSGQVLSSTVTGTEWIAASGTGPTGYTGYTGPIGATGYTGYTGPAGSGSSAMTQPGYFFPTAGGYVFDTVIGEGNIDPRAAGTGGGLTSFKQFYLPFNITITRYKFQNDGGVYTGAYFYAGIYKVDPNGTQLDLIFDIGAISLASGEGQYGPGALYDPGSVFFDASGNPTSSITLSAGWYWFGWGAYCATGGLTFPSMPTSALWSEILGADNTGSGNFPGGRWNHSDRFDITGGSTPATPSAGHLPTNIFASGGSTTQPPNIVFFA